ncbi:MAG TPA: ABC transporter substrate-binding protein [Candidatus Corynebacterium avicola]|uniref:ABC transporter substrate-binding protein n=1 Tax=Candidatus Corynebacterium avicola TaxID=2838527 RepID=A0A9D1RQW0_9CORY|nr:ABC transporter substrate-binding protein [Candidatus Corynebacterium avicola]
MSRRTLSTAPLNRRSFLVGTLATGAAAVLAACSSGDDSLSESGDDSASDGSDEQTPRVIALSTGHLDHLLLLGIVPVGLAVAKSSGTDTRGIPDYITERFGDDLDLSAIEIVGERQTPDLEQMATLEPDLILSNDRTEQNQLDQYADIAEVVTTNGGSEQWKDDLAILADAVDRREQADEFLDDYEKRAKEWGESRSGNPSISLIRGRGDEYLTFGPLSLAGSVAADAGLERPESQQFTDSASMDLATENAAMLDADYLFYGFAGESGEFAETDTWKRLPVVADGNAYEVDLDPWFLNASLVAAEVVLDDMIEIIGE